MEFLTIGRENSEWQIPLVYHSEDRFDGNWGFGNGFRFVLMESGSGIATIAGQRELLIAPSLFCLNETEDLGLDQTRNFKAKTLFFHPSAINSMFDFKNIRENGLGLTASEFQDLFWLKPFIERNVRYFGHLQIGLTGFQKVNALLHAAGQELHLQNQNWPCRSRSYLLELLFWVERFYTEPESMGKINLPAESEMDRVISYLSNNYQRPVALEELTAVFHVNRTTLANRFRKVTGMSLKEYHNKLRTDMAALMLRDTLLPVSEVMERLGFIDLTHFGRTFQRFTGYTPSEYRRLYCWMLKSFSAYQRSEIGNV